MQLWAEAVDANKAMAAAGRLRSVGMKRMFAVWMFEWKAVKSVVDVEWDESF